MRPPPVRHAAEAAVGAADQHDHRHAGRAHVKHGAHGDADAADVGLDAERLAQKIPEKDAQQVAQGQQGGTENDHPLVSLVSPSGIAALWRRTLPAAPAPIN